LCSAANPETIHMCNSSIYGVLELEESRFTHVLWQKNGLLDFYLAKWPFVLAISLSKADVL